MKTSGLIAKCFAALRNIQSNYASEIHECRDFEKSQTRYTVQEFNELPERTKNEIARLTAALIAIDQQLNMDPPNYNHGDGYAKEELNNILDTTLFAYESLKNGIFGFKTD